MDFRRPILGGKTAKSSIPKACFQRKQDMEILDVRH